MMRCLLWRGAICFTTRSGSRSRPASSSRSSSSSSSSASSAALTLGDTHTLRVRVDVDETDVSKLVVGQKAQVTADAYGDKKFWGRVVRIGTEPGRKNIRTDEPTEHVDTKILETLVRLEDGAGLPVGLRVDSFILANDEAIVSSK